jgi:hypothetical protein
MSLNPYEDLISNIKKDTDKMLDVPNTNVGMYMSGVQNVANAYIGHDEDKTNDSDYYSILKNTLDKKLSDSSIHTTQFLDYSDMYANNQYIDNELTRELDNSQRFVALLKNNIYDSKMKNQEAIYQKNRYNFYSVIVDLTTFLSVVSLGLVRLALREMIEQSFVFFALIFFVFAYLIVVSIMFVKNSKRTRLDWNKYVWENPEKQKKK